MITTEFFGTLSNGTPVNKYTITNNRNVSVSVINYRAAITNIIVPDKNLKPTDVVLGYDTLSQYENDDVWFGAIVGRYANRLRNGSFSIDGVTYQVPSNENGISALHGGNIGLNDKVWKITPDGNKLICTTTSFEHDDGFPGDVLITLSYELTDENELFLSYTAESSKKTIINLTNHSYFNLDGDNGESGTCQYLKLNSDFYLPVDSQSCPTGEILNIHGTPFDFSDNRLISKSIEDDDIQLKNVSGYDHTFVMNRNERGSFGNCALLYSSHSGIHMEVKTTMPGVQFYSGNFIGRRTGKNGVEYNRRDGICLETHYFPDAMYHSHFPSPLLDVGEVYSEKTSYKFFY